LVRELADRRIYPAIDIGASGTRREELLAPPAVVSARQSLRRRLGDLPTAQGVETVIGFLGRSQRKPRPAEADLRERPCFNSRPARSSGSSPDSSAAAAWCWRLPAPGKTRAGRTALPSRRRSCRASR